MGGIVAGCRQNAMALLSNRTKGDMIPVYDLPRELVMKVWINGELRDHADAAVSVSDHGLLYGDGVFEGIRIYGGRIFQCKAHLDRLYTSAEAIRLEIPYTPDQLTEAMDACIAANGLTDSGYIRLVVTRGAGTLGLNPFKCPTPTVFIIADQLAMYDRSMYENGIGVIIAKTVRVAHPQIPSHVKSLNYMNNILAKIECVDAGLPEAIMLNTDGNVAEASGDNIFIVKEGRVMTPGPQESILLGITRGVVIHLARRMGLPMDETVMTPRDLFGADECFLTGTGAEIIAVTSIDGQQIGNGKIGPITARLTDAFHEFVKTDEQVPYTI
jgi:branched-chain amino acid aminotransferase